MALHRDDVIAAALELLDEVGLERLTTRALTERLGVAPGALYWHVRSKRELLGAMADAVVAPAFAPAAAPASAAPGEGAPGWAGRTEAFAHRLRGALLGRRDGARLVSAHLAPGAATLGAVEDGLALMRGEGLSPAQAGVLGHAVTSYVIGFVLQEQSGQGGDGHGGGTAGFDPARYPNLLQWQAEQAGQGGGDAFTAGLALLTAGLAAQLGPGVGNAR
ncbi:TetR/AcrR family transcriptional regulator C-terminal domain-containing protein [Kitasatospora sp. NPDC058162]|uniref:TetR/AcrR family transcriptional regulator C-terminal domain-containing protein n=1 Tax=Kitasatospora sp. NPDC058162 TaxID=3346362 RepID=UPI0036DA9864